MQSRLRVQCEHIVEIRLVADGAENAAFGANRGAELDPVQALQGLVVNRKKTAPLPSGAK